MALLLILPLLVSGLLVCLYDPLNYYKLHRYEGQLLYLQAGRFGLQCLLGAFLAVGIVSLVFSHSWGQVCLDGGNPHSVLSGCHNFSTDYLSWIGHLLFDAKLVTTQEGGQATVFGFLTGIVTLIMPFVWAARSKSGLKAYLKSKDEAKLHSFLTRETLRHSPIGCKIMDAFAFKRAVMITMSDRKVYVGLIQSVGAPTEVTGLDLEIQLLPSFSGYRDKDTLKVTYTNTYPSEPSLVEPICLMQENIVSLSMFSEKIREHFKSEEASSKRHYDL